jgi:hypothetical protein
MLLLTAEAEIPKTLPAATKLRISAACTNTPIALKLSMRTPLMT